MKAYKFLRRDDLSKVFKDHTLLLSSAADIRAAENGGAGKGDRWDTAFRWKPSEGRYPLHPDHPLARAGGQPLKEGTTITFGAGVTIDLQADGLMFCAAQSRDEETAKRMKQEFGYDTSFEIKDFEKLCLAIARALDLDVKRWGARLVKYSDPDPTSEAVLCRSPYEKEVRFDWQKEVRFFTQGELPTQAIRVPGLWRYIGVVRSH